ncbi:MAG: FixH family protein [Polyangiaceae bacterium]
MTFGQGSRWLGLLLTLVACASNSDGEPSSSLSQSDCSGQADAIGVGLTKTSKDGTRFELRALSPSVPVQSPGAPGNHWSVALRRADDTPLTGAALNVTTFMPVHGHAGPSTVGIESSTDGDYDIDLLVFPMPALYAVTLTATMKDAEPQSVAIYVCVEAASG